MDYHSVPKNFLGSTQWINHRPFTPAVAFSVSRGKVEVRRHRGSELTEVIRGRESSSPIEQQGDTWRIIPPGKWLAIGVIAYLQKINKWNTPRRGPLIRVTPLLLSGRNLEV